MYLPAHFEERRPKVLQQLIADHPLGALVTLGPDGLDANHLPFEFEPAADGDRHGVLRAHVARANPVWREARQRPETLVIFQGPAAYLSPSWYPGKAQTHRFVPTWQYMVVHAHGRIKVHDDERYVRGVVARLTRKMEAEESVPWKIGDAPPDYIDQMLTQIVGLEIEVERLVGKWKLGQNRTPQERLGAAERMRERGGEMRAAVADAMRAADPRDPA
jgi:transcriptional regulator